MAHKSEHTEQDPPDLIQASVKSITLELHLFGSHQSGYGWTQHGSHLQLNHPLTEREGERGRRFLQPRLRVSVPIPQFLGRLLALPSLLPHPGRSGSESGVLRKCRDGERVVTEPGILGIIQSFGVYICLFKMYL